MKQTDTPVLRHHEDPDLFREAVNFTAAQTGFLRSLIEKDYFATLFLACMAGGKGASLVFKGGTCLAKVHAGFYRLSEDLDFVIPVKEQTARKERRRLAEDAKELFNSLPESLAGLHIAGMLRGANQSRQYLGRVGYRSVLTGEEQTIKIEVSLREPLLVPAENTKANTILISPVLEGQMVAPVPVRCISFKEAMAEKFRAALTRRETAIRDFYDIDYAVRHVGLDVDESDFKELVKAKLAVPGNEPVKLDPGRFDELRSQLDGKLKPVLRPDDFQAFDLERAIRYVEAMAKKVSKS